MSLFSSDTYDYELPVERIAQYPCVPRDHARLLCFEGGKIAHHRFYELDKLLPQNATLFLNQSAVLPVRLKVRRGKSSSPAEVFLLEGSSSAHLSELLDARAPVRCHALLRPAGRIAIGSELTASTPSHSLWVKRKGQTEVELRWHPEQLSFEEMLLAFGEPPIPPYLKRDLRSSDVDDYQCVYGRERGSVAAPTAGLHFTSSLLERLKERVHQVVFLKLHVGGGTFLPLQTNDLRDHHIHAEQFTIDRGLLDALRQQRYRVSVGTTSCRSIESVYWYGCMLKKDPRARLDVPPFVYQQCAPSSVEEALDRVSEQLQHSNLGHISGYTSLYIAPGYRPRLMSALITNFHQPRSTLLVLLASIIGPKWRDVYRTALEHPYRFLSYGDACLFYIKERPTE